MADEIEVPKLEDWMEFEIKQNGSLRVLSYLHRIKVAKMAREQRERKEAEDAALSPMERILRDQLARPSLKPRKINARVFPR